MTTAMWMESARRDAHNLDDLRERWLLRKSEASRHSGELFNKDDAPDYTHPQGVKEAISALVVVRAHLQKCEVRLAANKAKKHKDTHSMLVRESVLAERAYLSEARAFLIEYLKAHGFSARAYKLMKYGDDEKLNRRLSRDEAMRCYREAVSGNEYAVFHDALQLLHSLRSTGRVEFSDDEFVILNTMRDVLIEHGAWSNSPL